MKLLHVFCMYCLILGLLCSVSAKPLTTEKIIFSSDRDGNSQIYMMNPGGSQQVRLTDHPAPNFQPVCSPTGEEILFVSTRTGNHDLYIMRADGKGERPVFPEEPAFRKNPVWSPDGKKFAYAQIDFDAKRTTIYTAKTDGTLINRIVEIENTGIGEPVWSPDGTEIAFVVLGEIFWSSHQIRFINLETNKQETFLPDHFPRMSQPAWSLVHNKIAFTWHNREIAQSIFIANRDGSELQPIVDVLSVSPAWSPSGNELLYTEIIGNKTQIFKINVITREITQLTHDGSNYSDDWFDPLALPVSPQSHLLTSTWGGIKTWD